MNSTATISMLVDLVYQWAQERKFYELDGATELGQKLKLMEEVGELNLNYRKKKSIKDDIGDIVVVIIVLTGFHGMGWSIRNSINTDLCELSVEGCFATDALDFLSTQQTILSLYSCLLDGNTSDAVRMLALLARRECNCSILECLALAYDEIKDRKGEMRNGMFIKEVDLLAEKEYTK